MNLRLFGVVLAGSGLLALRSFSQSPVAPPATRALPASKSHVLAPPPLPYFEATGHTLDGFGWTQQPWTGNDAPYQTVRDEIDRALVRGTNPLKLVAAYRAKEEYDSQNPVAVFGWAYARYASSQKPSVNYNPVLWDVPGEMAEVPSPKTYNFIRLRFLTEAQGRDTTPLRNVGERLLQQDPTDPDVSLFLVRVLRPMHTPEATSEAAKLMEALVAHSPQVPLYHQLLANVYSDVYMSQGFQPKNAQLAIVSFQNFLRVAPANDPQREGCEKAIHWLQKGLTMDWTQARVPRKEVQVPPTTTQQPAPQLHEPTYKYPKGPGEPLPPAPLE